MVPQDVEQMPAAGSSKVVKVPSGARRNPCRATLASRVNPVIAPEVLMPLGKVPWLAAVPAPGASNLMMVVSVPPAFTERTAIGERIAAKLTRIGRNRLLLLKFFFIIRFCKLVRLLIGKRLPITRSR